MTYDLGTEDGYRRALEDFEPLVRRWLTLHLEDMAARSERAAADHRAACELVERALAAGCSTRRREVAAWLRDRGLGISNVRLNDALATVAPERHRRR